MLTLEASDLEKGMFSKRMKLNDSKQEPREYKAKERLNPSDKQECEQIRSLCNENCLQGNASEANSALESHGAKPHSKAGRAQAILNFAMEW